MSYKKKYESSELAQKYLVLSQDLSFLEEESNQNGVNDQLIFLLVRSTVKG